MSYHSLCEQLRAQHQKLIQDLELKYMTYMQQILHQKYLIIQQLHKRFNQELSTIHNIYIKSGEAKQLNRQNNTTQIQLDALEFVKTMKQRSINHNNTFYQASIPKNIVAFKQSAKHLRPNIIHTNSQNNAQQQQQHSRMHQQYNKSQQSSLLSNNLYSKAVTISTNLTCNNNVALDIKKMYKTIPHISPNNIQIQQTQNVLNSTPKPNTTITNGLNLPSLKPTAQNNSISYDNIVPPPLPPPPSCPSSFSPINVTPISTLTPIPLKKNHIQTIQPKSKSKNKLLSSSVPINIINPTVTESKENDAIPFDEYPNPLIPESKKYDEGWNVFEGTGTFTTEINIEKEKETENEKEEQIKSNDDIKIKEENVSLESITNDANDTAPVQTQHIYRCDICNKQFRWKQDLGRHKMIHSGERAFQCEYCRRSFVQKSNLVVHKRNHIGERPYQCYKCGKKYAHSTNLNGHLLLHKENEK